MIVPPEIAESLQWAASQAKVPVAIVRAVAYHESRFNPSAVSPAGAKGLMQIMPVNLEKYGVSDPFDIDQNARVGAEILSQLKARHGTWEKALAAYVWGTGNVSKKPSRDLWPQSTRDYVDRVLKTAGMSVAVAPYEPEGNASALLLAGLPVALALMRRR